MQKTNGSKHTLSDELTTTLFVLTLPRLNFSDAVTQRTWFAAQFRCAGPGQRPRSTQLNWPCAVPHGDPCCRLAATSGLPMFLHLRAATQDFLSIWEAHEADCPAGGVVHSFDGSLEELQAVLAHPVLRIGINGCSLKTGADNPAGCFQPRLLPPSGD